MYWYTMHQVIFYTNSSAFFASNFLPLRWYNKYKKDLALAKAACS